MRSLSRSFLSLVPFHHCGFFFATSLGAGLVPGGPSSASCPFTSLHSPEKPEYVRIQCQSHRMERKTPLYLPLLAHYEVSLSRVARSMMRHGLRKTDPTSALNLKKLRHSAVPLWDWPEVQAAVVGLGICTWFPRYLQHPVWGPVAQSTVDVHEIRAGSSSWNMFLTSQVWIPICLSFSSSLEP